MHAIFGIKTKPERKSELQAIRFDSPKFSVDEARRWLAKHNHKPILFEPATGKDMPSIKFFKENVAKQIVYGVVLAHDVVDLQKEWVSKDDIEEAAHDFLTKSRRVMLSHKEPLKAEIVESYIAPIDFESNGQKISEGDWVAAMKIYDAAVWKMVESGDIVGFSIGGFKTFV